MNVFAMALVGMVGVVSPSAGGDVPSNEAQYASTSVLEECALAEQMESACADQIHLYQDCKRCCNNETFVFSDEEYCNCDGIRPSEE